MKVRETAVLLLSLTTAPAAAQDLARSTEMPGHRALMDVMQDAEPGPFETDGCSGGLSTSWRLVADTLPDFADAHPATPPWELCCVVHDRAYHNAGQSTDPDQSYDARLEADRALRACVVENGEEHAEDFSERYGVTPNQVRAAYETIAGAMYLAVRFGGGPCTGLPWRWGFGYGGCTPFDGLSPARE